jgi:hypothetical protein
MRVAVTLRPDYLARAVSLVVRRTGYKSRRWTLYGLDSVNCLHPVTVDGEPVPTFKTRREAVAYLGVLRVHGVEVTRIWAEPRGRIGNLRPHMPPAGTAREVGRPAEWAAA